MKTPVEVLIDRSDATVNLYTANDETTLSIDQAWKLGVAIAEAIAKLTEPERVRQAVLESVGSDKVPTERYAKPGAPATIEHGGLADLDAIKNNGKSRRNSRRNKKQAEPRQGLERSATVADSVRNARPKPRQQAQPKPKFVPSVKFVPKAVNNGPPSAASLAALATR